MKTRIAVAGISHETNTFSGIKTDLENFHIFMADDIVENFRNTRTVIGGFLDVAEEQGTEIVPIISASAMPGGKVANDAYMNLRGRLLEGLKKIQVDGVLLELHGAMVTEDLDDPEGDILREVRRIVGKNIAVGSSLDQHGNVTELMVKEATVLVGYKTSPHIDQYETGRKVAELIFCTIKGEMKPFIAIKNIPWLLVGDKAPTSSSPFSEIMDEARRTERLRGVLCTSVFTGFALADIPEPYPSVVVVTDNNEEVAEKTANEMADLFWKERAEFEKTINLKPIEKAIDEAMAVGGGPVVLADTADNPTSGSAQDTTTLLRAMLKKGVKNAVIAVIADPGAVKRAIRAGIDNDVSLVVGGKVDKQNSKPLRLKGRVRMISDGRWTTWSGVKVENGKTIILDADGIDVILTEKRTATSDPRLLRSLGIEPAEKNFIALKDGLHFRNFYKSIAKKTIFPATPGWSSMVLKYLHFHRLKRPVYPLDVM